MKHFVPPPHKSIFSLVLGLILLFGGSLAGQELAVPKPKTMETPAYSPQKLDSILVAVLEKNQNQTYTAMQIQGIYGLFNRVYSNLQTNETAMPTKLATVNEKNNQIALAVLHLPHKDKQGRKKSYLAAAAMAEGVNNKNLVFVLPQTNFFGFSSTLQATEQNTNETGVLQVDFADGKGYQNIEIAKPVAVNYTDTGFKKLQFRYEYKNKEGKKIKQQATSWLYVAKPLSPSIFPAGKAESVCKSCLNDDYVNQDCKFIAPVPTETNFATEKINENAINSNDGGNSTNRLDEMGQLAPDEEFTVSAVPRRTWANNNGVVSGDAYLFKNCEGKMKDPIVIVECFDEKNRQGYEWGVTLFEPFMKEVLKRGYSVVLVNFRQSGDWIENNGLVLRGIINKLNADYGPYSSNLHYQNIQAVIGQSMGGQVARYELKHMEANANPMFFPYPNTPYPPLTNVKNYISLDSPHRGANIPLGMQWMLFDLTNQLSIGIVWQVLQAQGFGWLIELANQTVNSLNWGSAQQMIKYHIGSGGGDGPSGMFGRWQNTLNITGYPQHTHNIAIVNGNMQGRKATDLQNLQGQNVIEYEWSTTFWIGILPNPIRANGKAYFAPPATQTTESRLSFVYMMYNALIGHVSQERNRVGMAGYDVAAGSYYETQKEVIQNLQGLINAGATVTLPAGVDRHTFIPSGSAADFTPPAGIDEDSDAYLNTPLLGSYTQPTFPYEVINSTQYGFKEVHPGANGLDPIKKGNIWHLDTKYLENRDFINKYFPDIAPAICPEPYFPKGALIKAIGKPVYCIGRDLTVQVDEVPFATHYSWYVNGNLAEEFGERTFYLPLTGQNNYVSVKPCSWFTNTCGSPITRNFQAVRCNIALKEINIYPNPATHNFTITTDEPILGIKITNTVGQILYEIGTTEQRPVEVNIESWKEGFYIVQVTTPVGILTEKIIITK
jgi:hypothetical protein